jgi:ankyrin repeat protein
MASGDHRNMVEFLIEKGADVNTIDEYGMTALMWTAMFGKKSEARLLLAKGADVNVRVAKGFEKGKTSLLIAIQNKHNDLADLLKKHGARE